MCFSNIAPPRDVMLLMRRVTPSLMPPFPFDANWNGAMIVEGALYSIVELPKLLRSDWLTPYHCKPFLYHCKAFHKLVTLG